MDDNQNQTETQEQIETTMQSPNVSPMATGGRRLKSKGNKPKALIVVIVVLFIVGGALLFWGMRRGTGETQPSPTPELFGVIDSPETEESTPTPEPVDRSEVAISILNGTGIGGEAGFLQEKFEALGYENIEVGNASSQDNETTTVTFSTDLPDAIVSEITEELESIYEDVDVNTSSTQSADVAIVTGLRKGQTPIPEATSTPQATSAPTSTPTATPTAPSNITI